MKIYCTGCKEDVDARLTNGLERYPHRKDLADLPFWKCDTCGNYVGCHHKSDHPTKPLGVIATPDLVEARKHIHALIDPLWRKGAVSRAKIYARLSHEMGYEYHTGETRTIDEARKAYEIALQIRKEYSPQPQLITNKETINL